MSVTGALGVAAAARLQRMLLSRCNRLAALPPVLGTSWHCNPSRLSLRDCGLHVCSCQNLYVECNRQLKIAWRLQELLVWARMFGCSRTKPYRALMLFWEWQIHTCNDSHMYHLYRGIMYAMVIVPSYSAGNASFILSFIHDDR